MRRPSLEDRLLLARDRGVSAGTCHQVLVMTVNPSFGHQHFIHTTLPKIRRVCEMIQKINLGCDLEDDGGINAETARLVVDAGANLFVDGSLFGDDKGVAAVIRRLRRVANGAVN